MCVHTQWLKGHKSGDLSSLLALSWKHELSYGGTDAFIMSVLTYFCSIFYPNLFSNGPYIFVHYNLN